MSVFHSAYYDRDGRVTGSYVYMLLCPDTEFIFIKVGMSQNPIKRLGSLKTACAVAPETLAIMPVQSSYIAASLEKALHTALAPWRTTGEWFRFKAEDKGEFNAIWKRVVAAFSADSTPLKWTMLSVSGLLEIGRQQRRAKLRRRKQFRPVAMDALRHGIFS
jgi:hypothetical protein